MGILDYTEPFIQNQSTRYGGFFSVIEGEVVDNVDDENKGMIKVKFPFMQDKKDTVEKVRLLLPYAGEKQGFYFIPEKGDRVLVLFAGERFTDGYILGSVYKSSDKAIEKNYDKKNKYKEIKTAGGISIKFTDEEKKEKLEMSTPKENSFTIDDQNDEISIKDKKSENEFAINTKDGKLTLEAKKSVIIKSGKSKIELKDDGSIEISGNNISIKGQNNTIEAKAKNELKGQEINIEGKISTKINGKTKLECTSSGQVKVSGSIIKLN